MKKLVAYITCAYPDKNFTEDLILSLAKNGADKIELGIPFSDPVADGAVIEEANQKALQSGFKMRDLFDISKKTAREVDTYWMGYFNPFYKKDTLFINNASQYGVKGFIIPDLPYEESLELKQKLSKKEISLITFVAPTDSKDRISKIAKESEDFVYLVAYAGITGAGRDEDLRKIIEYIKDSCDTDVYIGFGVNEKNAKQKAESVDGVIVGTAFVKILLDENLTKTQKIDNISKLALSIKEKINS